MKNEGLTRLVELRRPYIALSRMAKSFKDYRKGKSPCSKAGGYGGMSRDAGEPVYKNTYVDPPEWC